MSFDLVVLLDCGAVRAIRGQESSAILIGLSASIVLPLFFPVKLLIFSVIGKPSSQSLLITPDHFRFKRIFSAFRNTFFKKCSTKVNFLQDLFDRQTYAFVPLIANLA
jgi:hypothetical protein